MKNLITRTLSGLLFVTIIVGSILLSSYSFAAVFALISAIAVWEFHKLLQKDKNQSFNTVLAMMGNLLLFVSTYLFASGFCSSQIFFLYVSYIILIFVVELFRKDSNAVENWAYQLLGQIYIAFPFALLNLILFMPKNYNPWLLLSMFLVIWLYDTGAYLVGVSIGKHRMCERISPKKSWEGFLGGLIVALLTAWLCSLYIKDLNLLQWIGFSALIVVFANFGDFTESLLKRNLGVKDSGNIMPGHGGLLDRFDSMLLVAPAIYIYLSLLF